MLPSGEDISKFYGVGFGRRNGKIVEFVLTAVPDGRNGIKVVSSFKHDFYKTHFDHSTLLSSLKSIAATLNDPKLCHQTTQGQAKGEVFAELAFELQNRLVTKNRRQI